MACPGHEAAVPNSVSTPRKVGGVSGPGAETKAERRGPWWHMLALNPRYCGSDDQSCCAGPNEIANFVVIVIARNCNWIVNIVIVKNYKPTTTPMATLLRVCRSLRAPVSVEALRGSAEARVGRLGLPRQFNAWVQRGFLSDGDDEAARSAILENALKGRQPTDLMLRCSSTCLSRCSN